MWDSRITQLGKFMGTPKYLAPEYIELHYVSPALDVYQIGLVLAELVTGISPVPDVSPLDCATRHMAGNLVLPDVLMESGLGDVLEVALARDNKERFEHAKAFATALAGIDLDSLPNLRPVGPDRQAVPPPRIPVHAAVPLDVETAAPSDWTFMPGQESSGDAFGSDLGYEAPTVDLVATDEGPIESLQSPEVARVGGGPPPPAEVVAASARASVTSPVDSATEAARVADRPGRDVVEVNLPPGARQTAVHPPAPKVPHTRLVLILFLAGAAILVAAVAYVALSSIIGVDAPPGEPDGGEMEFSIDEVE
jgi:hypothetical protein